ncbi:hypothetical protein NTE_02787 [Candidatus Nitrososphaera evergladensis SR1]|uniref:Uncharacterized protein n=1 Tax=Candidatus Nitrososphaera evergladensis SR1 TaxID=1459636 RepID=A0A075MUN0_9ARCH|nr:hypothetical protein [Candidatus Nitrososphaera evergladensis]AIF84828.1 hypothetical protein NTE_02787 [Candidatus Nitrososphaera evergladensis SR1]
MIAKTAAASIMMGIVFATALSFAGILIPTQIQAQNMTEPTNNMTAMNNSNSNSSVLAGGAVNSTGLDTFSAAGPIAGLILPASPAESNSTGSNMTLPSSSSQNTTALASVVPAKTFILSGAWHLNAENGKVTFFDARFTKVHLDASNRHVHEISNFRPASNDTSIRLNANGTTTIMGTTDVALNHAITWTNVKTAIVIDKLSTITIMLDPKDTSNHFVGQSIYGTVSMLKDKNGNHVAMFARP